MMEKWNNEFSSNNFLPIFHFSILPINHLGYDDNGHAVKLIITSNSRYLSSFLSLTSTCFTFEGNDIMHKFWSTR